MKLIRWSYTKRYNIKAIYDQFPNSNVIFRKISNYYFVYIVNWASVDPAVTKKHLEEMELLLNDELGSGDFYKNRKSKRWSEGFMKKAMIIANPSSGKEKAKEYIQHIESKMEEANYEVDIRFTEGEGDAERLAREACEKTYDAVIAMGGDGTMNETVNGLAEQPHRPVLGVIPLGTVNDFARALKIPLEPEEAIAHLTEETKSVDIGKINNRYFLNILALGGIAEAVGDVPIAQKTNFGPLAYLMEGIKTLKEKTPFSLQIVTDQHTYEEEALLFLAALTNSVGGFEQLAPEAEIEDGFIHCFIVRDVFLPKLVRVGVNLLKGDLQHDPDVIYFRAKKLSISSPENLEANVDGDLADSLPLDLKVLHGHLQVFVPA